MTGFPNSQGNTLAAIPVYETCQYTQVSTSGQIKATPGYFAGLIVTASSSGAITLYDNTAGSGTALYTGTMTAGQVVLFPAQLTTTTGLYFALVSGSATVNVLWR